MKKKAYASAMTLLSRREYSRLELQKRLIQKGYTDQIVEEILGELSNQQLQSDARFVENYIRGRKRRGYGIQRIRLELEQKGVEPSLMAPFLESASDDWQQRILDVWEKKFHGKQPRVDSDRIKQLRFLHYRGFTTDQIQWVWQRENQ